MTHMKKKKKSLKHLLILFLSFKRFINHTTNKITLFQPKRKTIISKYARNYKLYISNNCKKNNYDVDINIRRNNFLSTQHQNDIDYIYGLNSVCAVLEKNERDINKVIINRNIKFAKKIHKKTYDYVFNKLKEREIETCKMTKKEMDTFVGGFPHNDIIMQGSYRYMKNYKYFFKNVHNINPKNNIYICLYNVYDNMNIGNICRTILFFGGDTIFLKKKKKKNDKKKKIKIDTPILHSSVGSSEFLEFYHVNDMANFINHLKINGFKIYSTCCEEDDITTNSYVNLKDVQINKNDKILIILGNESKGIDTNILKLSDVCIYIKSLYSNISFNLSIKNNNRNFILNSLNVNNACSIILYHFFYNML
ncbi:rRNA methyltransferase, putative [Hepatocystis sp. ex Piliocolobus tephrosceles]|nr:rRNA methyltransferase, putative [Hepatocystis sp. ex Piliocolobus tephrosceles]